VIGPIKPKGIDGSEWAIMMTDDKTRARWVYPLQKKGDAYRAIVNFCELIKTQYGSYPKIIRIDNGTEYGGGALKAYCSGRGILIEYTVAYTPEQDGVSERSNRTTLEKTRTMISSRLFGPKLSKRPCISRTGLQLSAQGLPL
jgi:transposase InsO family protein